MLPGAVILATTHHVDAVNGNDDIGDGTAGNSYQTLSRVRPLLLGGDTVILYNGNYGTIVEGEGPSNVFDNWVTYKAADEATSEIESIRFGANGAQYYGQNYTGTYDVYMRFVGIHILDGVRMYGPRHVAFEDCLIERIGPWTGSGGNIEKTAVGMRGGKDITVKDCEITRTGTGITAWGHDVKLLNNNIHDITHDGIRCTGLWDSLVEGNIIHGLDDGVNDADGFNWNRHCDGIHIFIAGSPNPDVLMPNHNVTFRGNIIYDIEAQGVQFNNYYAFPEVRNNNITFENNIFGPTCANVFNNADPCDGLIFRHNSFIYFPDGREYVSQFRTIRCDNHNLRISGSSTNVQVYNNILVSSSGGLDWNLIQSLAPGAAYGQFTIIDTDLQFENPDAFDGKLLATSPAINAGTRIFAPTPIYEFDREGTPRDNRPDMGAYEVPGQYPDPEEQLQEYPGTKTIFVDDFEDADFKVDPWLEAEGQQGLSWYHPIVGSPRYKIQGDSAVPNPNNVLTGSMENKSSWLFSEQGSNWGDYTLEFDAYNSYLWIGAGPVLLVKDSQNSYWLDISRDNGRLVRFMTDSSGVPTETILATNSAIEMPHSGHRQYRISVQHETAGITFTVDADNDGSVELTYTDSDQEALAKFTAGGIGFHKDYPNTYHRMSYDNIKVTVSQFYQPPIAVISANPTSGQAPLTVSFNGFSSSDPNGEIEKYEWDFENDGVVDAQGVTTSYTYNTAGTYTAKLTVTDNQGLTGTVTISITASPSPNQPPIANAGTDQTVIDEDNDGEEQVTLDGSGSRDPDGTIVSFIWSEGGLEIATGKNPTVTLSTGTHSITLTVADDGGLTDTDTVTITVSSPANQPPLANAGPDQNVTDSDRNGSEQVTLDGSASSDPDGSIVSFIWREGGAQIATGAKPTVTLSTGTHTITLTVTDNGGLTGTDTVTITVSSPANQPPVANAGPDQTVTDSDRNGSEQVTLDGSASSDPDGNIVSFVWTEDGQQIATGVNPKVTLSVGTHNITLTVTDNGGLTDTDTVTIIVSSPANQPPLADAGQDQTVTDSDTNGSEEVTLDGSGSSDPDGSIVSFIWREGGAQIATGIKPTVTLSTGTHTITLTVTDNGGLTDTDTVTITVNNVDQNRPPVLDPIGNKSVNENTLLTFTVNATDPDGDNLTYSASNLPQGASFNTATRTFSWTPAYNQAGIYNNVHFEVSDGTATDSEDITITVNNVNRPPVLNAIGNKSINEGQALSFTVSGSDPDGDQITYSVQGLPDGATFENQTFTWTPITSNVGEHRVTFIVSDGYLSDSETIIIRVVGEEVEVDIRFNTDRISKIGILYISGETNEGAVIEKVKVLDEYNKILNIDINDEVSIDGQGNISGKVIVKDIIKKYPLLTGIKIRMMVRKGEKTKEGETGVARIEPYGAGPDKIGVYNNVFNPLKGEKTLIRIDITEQTHIKINLYDTRGKKIKEIADEERDAEICRYYWDGKDGSGNVVGSGLYFVHIEAGDYKKTKKIVVVK